MKNLVKDTIHANGIDIGIYTQDFENEFISLTDIARYKSDEPKDVIKNWMRSKDTIEFLGLWEKLHNSNFKGVEFDSFRNQAGSNAFTMSPTKWIETTGAIGIVSKSGRYGGTFAHSDIAFEFASWISAEFKLYIIKDYKRLKADENSRFSLNWNLNREISKLNYRIHTDAIKEKLIPPELTPAQISFTYANEADMLNVVLFGRTAKQWKDENPDIKGNMRDGATLNQLLILANLESYNAVLIHQGKNQKITDKDKKNFVIYKGQKLEADIAYIEIYQQAKKSIYVVDDYMNAKSLQDLSQKADGVEVVLFTENGKGGKGFLTKSLVTDFQNEYHSLQIKPNPDCHDRLIVLDYGEETELVYHCGASSKDAGKKLCAINQITETTIIHPVIDRLLLLPDKQI